MKATKLKFYIDKHCLESKGVDYLTNYMVNCAKENIRQSVETGYFELTFTKVREITDKDKCCGQ